MRSSSKLAARALVPAVAVILFSGLPPLVAQDPNPQLVFRVEAPMAELTTGSEFDSRVLLDSQVDGIQGFSFGVGHDPAALELLAADTGATTNTINAGGGPAFSALETEFAAGAGVTLAIVINFRDPVFLNAGEGYEILTMRYRVLADPTTADPCEPVQTGIAFTDELGDPPVATVISVMGSEIPVVENATITVRCPGTIELTRCEGDTENVFLEWSFGGVPEWDFLFLYRDGELREMLDPMTTSFTDQGLEPRDYEYTLLTFVVEDPASPSLIFVHCTATVIPVTVTSIEPSIGDWLGGTSVVVKGSAFTTVENTTLVFFSAEEDPLPLEIVEIRGETELTAVTPEAPRLGRYGVRIQNERGMAELPDAFEYGFIRGEMNSDAPIDITDPISLLDFLFMGGDPPRCRDSADFTDDGKLDISDIILVLNFLFLGGDPPSAPFPDPGQDPTSDSLGCLE